MLTLNYFLTGACLVATCAALGLKEYPAALFVFFAGGMNVVAIAAHFKTVAVLEALHHAHS